MDSDTVKLDKDGIPVLENPVDPDSLKTPPSPVPDLTDHEIVGRLLKNTDVQQLLDDMSEDLQKLVSWKIESLVQEQVGQLVKQIVETNAPKLAEDISTQLQLALPGLLAQLVEHSANLDDES